MIDGVNFTDWTLNVGTVIIPGQYLKTAKNVTVGRVTEVEADEPTITELAEFHPGHPVKANDLNENFLLMLQQVQEQLTLLQASIPVVSDDPPLGYKGRLWVNTENYQLYVYNNEPGQGAWIDV